MLHIPCFIFHASCSTLYFSANCLELLNSHHATPIGSLFAELLLSKQRFGNDRMRSLAGRIQDQEIAKNRNFMVENPLFRQDFSDLE